VRAAVPEEHKAYGVIVCGAALGDRAFEEHFLQEKTAEIRSEIESVVNKLAGDSAHALSTAIYYSLQARVDFLLETHLPSLTRSLARATDEALSKAYIKAFGFNLLDPNGQHKTLASCATSLDSRQEKGGVDTETWNAELLFSTHSTSFCPKWLEGNPLSGLHLLQ
jgi:L-aminopeptidase/D-esterase-like protein